MRCQTALVAGSAVQPLWGLGVGGGRGLSKQNGEKEKWSRNKLLQAFYVALMFYKDNMVKNK